MFCSLAIAAALLVVLSVQAKPVQAKPVQAKPVQGKNTKTTPTQWLLVQNHAELGVVHFYVTHDAVKAIISKTGCCMLAKAPKWQLHYYRPDEKAMWSGALERLEPASLVNPFNRSFGRKYAPIVVKKSDVPYVARSDQQAVELLGTGTTEGLHYSEYSTIRSKQRSIFWLTKDIAVDPKCAQVLCRFYGVPEMGQIPLYVRKTSLENRLYSAEREKNKATPFLPSHGALVTDLRTGPQVVMSTKSCKKVPFDAALFQVPTNYKKLAAIVDVTYSAKAKDDITSIMDDMAFTSDKRRSK